MHSTCAGRCPPKSNMLTPGSNAQHSPTSADCTSPQQLFDKPVASTFDDLPRIDTTRASFARVSAT